MLGFEPRIVADFVFAAINTYARGLQQTDDNVMFFGALLEKSWHPVLRREPFWAAVSIETDFLKPYWNRKTFFPLAVEENILVHESGTTFHLNIVNKAIDKGQNLASW